MKQTIYILLVLCMLGVCDITGVANVRANDYSPLRSTAQTVSFSFPALPGGEVKAYFFEGARLDSLAVRLDGEGKGSIRFPEGYHGFVQAVVDKASLVEFIAGEDNLFIESDDTRPSSQNASYAGSPENDFFFSMMERKKRNGQEREWLTAGLELYLSPSPSPQGEGSAQSGNVREASQAPSLVERAGGEVLRAEINNALVMNAQEKEEIDKEIASSPLYAARFIEITDFADKLFYAENQRDTAKMRYVKEYLPARMDWEALYTAGQLWTMVHNYTLSMFNKEDINQPIAETQQMYATFVSPLLLKVEKESIRSAMLKSILMECEAFGWEIAKTEIIAFVINNHITIDMNDTQIARFMNTPVVGDVAPHLSPDPSPQERGDRGIILFFYEPGCGNCEEEIAYLGLHGDKIKEQGYRVFLLSRDDHEDLFREYGIIGTPTIFVIDREGIIKGRYARIAEAILLNYEL